jgi:O-antigen/teichoic acid export membrane protein
MEFFRSQKTHYENQKSEFALKCWPTIQSKIILLIQRCSILIMTPTNFKSNLTNLTVVSVIIIIAGFFTSTYIGRSLGPEGFGILAYMVAIGKIIANNVRFGMDMTLLRDFFHYQDKSKEILVASVILRIIILAMCFSILLILNVYDVVTLSLGQLLVVLSTALMALQLNNYYDFLGKLKKSSVQNMVYRLLYFASIWIASYYVELSVDIIGWLMIVTLIGYLVVNYNSVEFTSIIIDSESNIKDVLFLLKENHLVWFATLLVSMAYSINRLIVGDILGEGDLGIFAASYLFVTAILMFYKQISRVVKPLMAKHTNSSSNDNFMKKYLFGMIGFGGVISITLYFLSDFLILTLLGIEYISSAEVLKYFSIFVFMKSIEIVLTQYFQYSRSYKISLLTNAAFGLSTVVLSIYLLPVYGVIGGAIAMSLGLFVSNVIALLYYKRSV